MAYTDTVGGNAKPILICKFTYEKFEEVKDEYWFVQLRSKYIAHTDDKRRRLITVSFRDLEKKEVLALKQASSASMYTLEDPKNYESFMKTEWVETNRPTSELTEQESLTWEEQQRKIRTEKPLSRKLKKLNIAL